MLVWEIVSGNATVTEGVDHYPGSLQIILHVTLLDFCCHVDMRLRGLPTLPRKINWSSHITSLSTFLPSHSPCFLWSACDDSVHTGCIILHSHIDRSVSLSVTQPHWDPAHSDKYRLRDTTEGLLQEDSPKEERKAQKQWKQGSISIISLIILLMGIYKVICIGIHYFLKY